MILYLGVVSGYFAKTLVDCTEREPRKSRPPKTAKYNSGSICELGVCIQHTRGCGAVSGILADKRDEHIGSEAYQGMVCNC